MNHERFTRTARRVHPSSKVNNKATVTGTQPIQRIYKTNI